MKERMTVVFLGNAEPPKYLMVLQRGPERRFAPNLFTGIGGHIEENEMPIAAALRELKEETEPSITGVDLIEFGRVIVNDGKIIHYYFGRDDGRALPSSNEGTLSRVSTQNMPRLDLIPTTKELIDEWANRMWDTSRPFTVYIERVDIDDINSPTVRVHVQDGLQSLA